MRLFCFNKIPVYIPRCYTMNRPSCTLTSGRASSKRTTPEVYLLYSMICSLFSDVHCGDLVEC